MSRSIYQSNGKPLSQQAIYQQKLRQGIYTSPSVASIGVNSNASDTAALLAASADLTVKPVYERVVAPEAQFAAVAARTEEISAWKRVRASDADAAAASARTSSMNTQSSSTYSAGGTGVPSFNGNTIFKAASQNSASTMTSRTNPERDVMRSGLTTKSQSSTMDIGKISQMANQNSAKSLNSRFNPELDYRSGLKINTPTQFLNQSEEDLAASGAAASLKHGSGYSDRASAQRRSQSFKAVDVVDGNLLAAASAKAQERLNSLNSSTQKDFKSQAQAYAKALTVAQQNSDERLKNHQIGRIDLGGGLFMTQAELDNMASLIVRPILTDIDKKVAIQRESDDAYKTEQANLAVLHQKAKQEVILQKSQEKADFELAKEKRGQENEENKSKEDGLFIQHQEERNGEVETKATELSELQAKYAEEKEVLLTEKQANSDRIDEEEAELIASRKKELEEMQAERDEILQPTLDELKEENSKLKDVTDARDELKNEVTSAEKVNEEYEAQVAELTTKLEETKAEIEKFTTDIEEAETKLAETTNVVDELHQTSAAELEDAEKTDKELDSKLKELDGQKTAHLATKSSNKDEIMNLIDESVKDEHKINAELPEHFRKDINEDKLRDTSSLFTIETPKVKEVPLFEEPKVAKVEKAVKAESKPEVTTPKKKNGLRRLSNIFKSTKDKTTKAVPISAPSKTVEAPSKPETITKKQEVKSKPTRINSNSIMEYDDDLSLNNQSKNQGGLFKEEI